MDGEEVEQLVPNGREDYLDVEGQILYFAGAPAYASHQQYNITHTSFLGCLRDAQVISRRTLSHNFLEGSFIGMTAGCRTNVSY